jgi:hypothetical protein
VAGADAGRKDTEFELRMTTKNVTSIATEFVGGEKQVLVRFPLHDRKGSVIGLLVVAFRPQAGVDKLMYHARALVILQEVSQQIPDAADIF